MFTVSKLPCLAPAGSPGLLGLTFVSCLDLRDAQGSSSFLFFTKVSSYGTEMFLWPQVCAERSNVNSRCLLLPSSIPYPSVLPTHHPDSDVPGLPPRATWGGELCRGAAHGTGTAGSPAPHALPARCLPALPVWGCLIVAIVCRMRWPIVLQPRAGAAGAGGSRSCPRVPTAPLQRGPAGSRYPGGVRAGGAVPSVGARMMRAERVCCLGGGTPREAVYVSSYLCF